MTRRRFIRSVAASAGAAAVVPTPVVRAERMPDGRRPRMPIIDITDLYHPHQDEGDNLDLITAYALPELDLRAVVLDVTERCRRPVSGPPGHDYVDATGPHDPGFLPVWQLNALFGRDVPCGRGPSEALRSEEDPVRGAPRFQQLGVELLLRVLRESSAPVEIVSFGSARAIAVAINRDPGLLRKQVARIHLCAGSAPEGCLEWNVMLDPHAFVRVLRSDQREAVYPCAVPKGPFDLGPNNSSWRLPDLDFLRDLEPGLRRSALYALSRSRRVDFLRALEEDAPVAVLEEDCKRPHHVWETAVWTQVSGRRLIRRADGSHRIVPADEVPPRGFGHPRAARALPLRGPRRRAVSVPASVPRHRDNQVDL